MNISISIHRVIAMTKRTSSFISEYDVNEKFYSIYTFIDSNGDSLEVTAFHADEIKEINNASN